MSADLTVHVVDDDDAVRDSLAFLLEAEGFKVRTYESAVRLLAEVEGLSPGCIVTDVRMPEMTGLELVRRLSTLRIPHPVVVMTGHGDVPLAVEAMKAGVIDFIEKPFDDDAMLIAVRAAMDRNPKDGGAAAAHTAEIVRRIEALSPREREVLQGLVDGKPNKIIAFDLSISPRTVEIYRANVMTKMQAGSLSELVRMSLLAQR